MGRSGSSIESRDEHTNRGTSRDTRMQFWFNFSFWGAITLWTIIILSALIHKMRQAMQAYPM
jgi:hypothetical protein